MILGIYLLFASIEACMPKMEALVEGIYCGTETCYEVLDVSNFFLFSEA